MILIFYNSCNIFFNIKKNYYQNESSYSDDEDDDSLSYGTDLTILAQKNKLEEAFGREKELKELIEVLAHSKKNNPALLGDASIGKTSIIHLFAKKMAKNLVPFSLQGRAIIDLNIDYISTKVSSKKDSFDYNFIKLAIFKRFNKATNIFFFDNIHFIYGLLNADGNNAKLNDILKVILYAKETQYIGASTLKEYKMIKKEFLETLKFQPINIYEIDLKETILILYNVRYNLENYHNLKISTTALEVSAELASDYIKDKFLPEKAIYLLDKAAAQKTIALTNSGQISPIFDFIAAGIKKFNELKIAAFNEGIMKVALVFEKLSFIYNNFLLKWIENSFYDKVKKTNSKNKQIQHSLNFQFSRKIELQPILTGKLLAFSKKKITNNKLNKVKNFKLSIQNINEVSCCLTKNFKNTLSKLNIRQTGLYFYDQWSKAKNFMLFLKKKIDYSFLNKRVNFFFKANFLKKKQYENLSHLRNVLRKIKYQKSASFISKKIYENNIENFQKNMLEKTNSYFLKKKLYNTKPILYKGIIQSLKESSKIKFTEKELNVIYTLMGYTKNIYFLNELNLYKSNISVTKFAQVETHFVNSNEIIKLVSELAGIPLETLTIEESEKLKKLEKILHQRVVGQEEAVDAISSAIKRSRLGIQAPNRPIASFFFCGPTGVGKTEVTKALASIMFGSEKEMIRFDMSEFMEKFTVSRLIGAPPGYSGYDEGGQLTNSVRKKPHAIVLFDEVEKGHPEILNILLQILEDGRLTDSQKILVNFEKTIIIMTSNVGSEEIQTAIKKERVVPIEVKEFEKKDKIISKVDIKDSICFNNNLSKNLNAFFLKFSINTLAENFISKKKNVHIKIFQQEKSKNSISIIKNSKNLKLKLKQQQKLKKTVMKRLSSVFLPEFLNRLDDIIVFRPLTTEELKKICDIMINNLINRMIKKNIDLKVSDFVKLKLTKEGYNPKFGARPLRRLVTKSIENLIVEDLLNKLSVGKEKKIEIILNNSGEIILKN